MAVSTKWGLMRLGYMGAAYYLARSGEWVENGDVTPDTALELYPTREAAVAQISAHPGSVSEVEWEVDESDESVLH